MLAGSMRPWCVETWLADRVVPASRQITATILPPWLCPLGHRLPRLVHAIASSLHSALYSAIYPCLDQASLISDGSALNGSVDRFLPVKNADSGFRIYMTSLQNMAHRTFSPNGELYMCTHAMYCMCTHAMYCTYTHAMYCTCTHACRPRLCRV